MAIPSFLGMALETINEARERLEKVSQLFVTADAATRRETETHLAHLANAVGGHVQALVSVHDRNAPIFYALDVLGLSKDAIQGLWKLFSDPEMSVADRRRILHLARSLASRRSEDIDLSSLPAPTRHFLEELQAKGFGVAALITILISLLNLFGNQKTPNVTITITEKPRPLSELDVAKMSKKKSPQKPKRLSKRIGIKR